jgi:hypothetical protein
MCYSVYISTDSGEDLTGRNSKLIGFMRAADVETDPCISLLSFPDKWLVTAPEGCSCGFRHLCRESVDLGFTEPQDWSPEGQEEIDATAELYRVLMGLLEGGHKVDLIDIWQAQTVPDDLITLDVSLDQIPEKAFRLFEGHKFRLRVG